MHRRWSTSVLFCVVLAVFLLAGVSVADAKKQRKARLDRFMRKWRLRKYVPYLKSWNWQGVNKTLFNSVRSEAQKLFWNIVDVNRSVEVIGHIWMFPDQASFYQNHVVAMKPGQQMCEVGFGSGLSTLGYLRSNPNISLVTFDLWEDTLGRFGFDPYLKKRKEMGANYLKQQFGDRWTLVKGDSRKTIPDFMEKHPDFMCDVIHIDGDHSRGGALVDLVYFQALAKPIHTVLMDDLQFEAIQKAMIDYLRGIRSLECYVTMQRDVFFLGRGGNRKAVKYWCNFEFNLDWSMQEDTGFKPYFWYHTNLTAPPIIEKGNRHKGVNVTALKLALAAKGEGGGGEVAVLPLGGSIAAHAHAVSGSASAGSGSSGDGGSGSGEGEEAGAGMASWRDPLWEYVGPPTLAAVVVCLGSCHYFVSKLRKFKIEIVVSEVDKPRF